ncbi:DUF4240 domain-containing protein [Actinoplanes sp. LDG1-06]|uniref:DUF4240 domain-containing protein n=1 Tax=Paractinoplanes ovalisporus TaxID=2810368 RepID=A0ABS2A452_9ACTN|nr:DUF4240 domain-containing protein [Actinoplanes ovalisporus]MBM2614597.1 DUF4240 domain-containing protein [Actinoplanes ovalisporus]
MNVDDFWTFLEASGRDGGGQEPREAFLSHRLGRIPREHVLDFAQHLSATREPANTYRLWRAADIILDGWCSTDGFHYFQMWLAGLGREAYEGAIAAPDSLAGHPEVRRLAALPRPWADEDYPMWESLEYVAVGVGEQRPDIGGDVRDLLTEERAFYPRMDPDPDDTEWLNLDRDELAVRYPQLWDLFGDRWRT